jgi:hypothetical protein
MSQTTVAVMQPYFYPYAGYFRLLAAADVFVIYDCVQFARRGRVHRCEVQGPSGSTEWLTLPLARQPRDVLIRDLEFADEARATLDERLARFDWIRAARGPMSKEVLQHLHGELGRPVDFLEDGLRLVSRLLGLTAPIIRSSSLAVPAGVGGQDRIISIVKALGGSAYVNPPGGRRLYSPQDFAAAGLGLAFLTPYHGPFINLLPALLSEDATTIRSDIMAQTHIET